MSDGYKEASPECHTVLKEPSLLVKPVAVVCEEPSKDPPPAATFTRALATGMRSRVRTRGRRSSVSSPARTVVRVAWTSTRRGPAGGGGAGGASRRTCARVRPSLNPGARTCTLKSWSPASCAPARCRGHVTVERATPAGSAEPVAPPDRSPVDPVPLLLLHHARGAGAPPRRRRHDARSEACRPGPWRCTRR